MSNTKFHGATVNAIYTYEHKEQEVTDLSFVPEVLSTERTFRDYLTAILTTEDKNQLNKISTCINLNNKYNFNHLPDWYTKCDGKFYF